MATSNDQLARALEGAGYFSDLDPSAASDLRSQIRSDGSAGALDHPGRVAFADIEDLAEGGVGRWLEEDIAPLLASRGVAMPPIENENFPEDESDGYSITVNGKQYQLWTATDVENSQATSTVAAFAIVNDVLQAEGASERLFFLDNGGGNDGMAWLLTPQQAQAIREFGGQRPSRTPFTPVNEPPHFGQPQ